MSDDKHIDEVTGIETTGHEWDGIRQLNNPMPRWWLWTFYGTVVRALGYMILYPAWPLINSATPGLLGYSSRAELSRDLDRVAQERAEMTQAVRAASLPEILADEKLRTFAVAGGMAAYRVNCSQCHGSGAQGALAEDTTIPLAPAGDGGFASTIELGDGQWIVRVSAEAGLAEPWLDIRRIHVRNGAAK